MARDSRAEDAGAAMREINRFWIDGNVERLESMLHPEIVMVLPDFSGRIEGREGFLAGFRDFCQNARIHEFRDHDYQIDVAGDTAVLTFRFEMIYERSGERYYSTGRDMWVFSRDGSRWIAVWRTMLDMEEKADTEGPGADERT